MFLRLSVILLLVGSVVQLVSSTAESHSEYESIINSTKGKPIHIDFGKRQKGDWLWTCSRVTHKSIWFWHVSYDFKYPDPKSYKQYKRITSISIFDVVPNGSKSKIIEGGLGKRKVVIKLRSRWFRRLDNIICIYGF